MSFEKTKGKGKIACNEQVLLIPQCFFFTLSEICPPFTSNFELSSGNSFNLGESEIFLLTKD